MVTHTQTFTHLWHLFSLSPSKRMTYLRKHIVLKPKKCFFQIFEIFSIVNVRVIVFINIIMNVVQLKIRLNSINKKWFWKICYKEGGSGGHLWRWLGGLCGEELLTQINFPEGLHSCLDTHYSHLSHLTRSWHGCPST